MLVPHELEETEVAGPLHGSGLVQRVNLFRVTAARELDPARRAEMGQFLTPPSVARFMAALFNDSSDAVRLLDAGAGVGTLTAAFVEDACYRTIRPPRIEVMAYELDPLLAQYLGYSLAGCQELCTQRGIEFVGDLRQTDFISDGVELLRNDLFASPVRLYNRAILNPPYRGLYCDEVVGEVADRPSGPHGRCRWVLDTRLVQATML